MKENKTTRIAPNFGKELDYIKKERLKEGLDRFKTSDRRLTKWIPKHPLWQEIKKDLIDDDLKENGDNQNE